MAVSKTLSANGSKGHHKFTLYVNESSTSGNNSYLSYSFQLAPLQSGWDWAGWSIPYTITIGGNTYTGNISSYNGSSTVTLKSGSNIEIAHDSDGTKTINVSFSVTDNTGKNYTCGNASASDTMTLTALHKPPLIGTAQVSELNSVVSNLNIPATTVVRYLSKKRFTLNATPYDSATLTYRLRGFLYDSGTQSSNVFDVDFRTNAQNVTFMNNTIQITQFVYDSKGASSSDDIKVLINNTPSVLNIIDYTKPTLERTSTNIKRKSGNGTNLTDNKANINVVGTIYKGSNAIGNNNAIRTIGYKVWEKGTSEPANYTSFSTTPTPTSSGSVTITNYEISNIDFTKAYNYKIILGDNYSNGTTYYTDVAEGTIPLGQPTWSEYKDRVDFLEITTKNKYLSNIGDTIKVYCSASQNISPQTMTKINTDTIEYNTSNKLSLSNDAIYIGENVHTVLVNCRWTAWPSTGNGRYIYIYKNGTLVAFNSGAYSSTMETSAVIPVEENDYIEMSSYHEQPSSVSTSNNKLQTFIQVTILG